MWVLSTASAELHYFSDSAAIPGGYAILSHTWARSPGHEKTFQEIHSINQKCKANGQSSRNLVGDKIRQCCEIAEHDGYEWVWIDTCCINKESSTELSEAINSMFDWYALAEVCYVHLEDVPTNDNPHDKNSEFRKARWHTRGWTLQELLAPVFVVFLSQEWKSIGTKYNLRTPLSECTGIDTEYLIRELDFRVDASIAKRMSWAADRKTTRVEDEAYCLLGLFDVNMSTLYGEGRQAFQRLQAELVRWHVDTSLFAWGGWHDANYNDYEQAPLSTMHDSFHDPDPPHIYLFAPSPSSFLGKSDAHPTPQSETGAELPSLEITPFGMKCRFPVAEVDGITIAILVCQTKTQHLGLLLHPAQEDKVLDSFRKQYYVSWAFSPQHGPLYHGRRVACLGADVYNLSFRGKRIEAEWRDIYIVAHPPTTGRTDGAHLLQRFHPDVARTPFRIPRALLQSLSKLKFSIDSWTISKDPVPGGTMSITCENPTIMEGFRILLGLCTKASESSGRPCHWAWAEEYHRDTWDRTWTKVAHDCARDHIGEWEDQAREFGDLERTIRVVFKSCPHDKETLVFGLELTGSIYEQIQRDANVFCPPPARLRTSSTTTGSKSHSAAHRSLYDIGDSSPTSSFSSESTAVGSDSYYSDAQKCLRQSSNSSHCARTVDLTESKELHDDLKGPVTRLYRSPGTGLTTVPCGRAYRLLQAPLRFWRNLLK